MSVPNDVQGELFITVGISVVENAGGATLTNSGSLKITIAGQNLPWLDESNYSITPPPTDDAPKTITFNTLTLNGAGNTNPYDSLLGKFGHNYLVTNFLEEFFGTDSRYNHNPLTEYEMVLNLANESEFFISLADLLSGDSNWNNAKVQITTADGDELPDYMKFNPKTQAIEVNADAARAQGQDNVVLQVTVESEDGPVDSQIQIFFGAQTIGNDDLTDNSHIEIQIPGLTQQLKNVGHAAFAQDRDQLLAFAQQVNVPLQ